MDASRLILASTSPYRRALLARLALPFTQHAPDFEELPPGSLPVSELVRANTLGKARNVLVQHPAARVIASDQLAICDDRVLGKPGSSAAAEAQLRAIAGRQVSFYTGVALLSAHESHYALERYHVEMRSLTDAEIATYVQRDQPLHCAGSFKSEGLGIALFARMWGDDPTALIGLPLIRLSHWLQPLRC